MIKKIKKNRSTLQLNRKMLYGVGGLILLVSVIFFIAGNNRENSSQTTGNAIVINPENFPLYLMSIPEIKDLPKKSNIHLRIGELNYKIVGNKVEKGIPDSPDIIVELPVEYVNLMNEGICAALQSAMNNGDLYFEAYSSNAKLMWKYKKMLKHRDCLGL